MNTETDAMTLDDLRHFVRTLIEKYSEDTPVAFCATPGVSNWANELSGQVGIQDDGTIVLGLEEGTTTEEEPNIDWEQG